MHPLSPLSGINRRLRRRRTFSPASIPGLKLWLKADAIEGLSDSDPVASWADASGEGNDATQATASKRPTYRTGVLNGLPVVRFDGVDDLLTTAGNIATVGSIFAVMDATGGGAVPSLGGMGSGSLLRIFTMFPGLTDSYSDTFDLLNVQSHVNGVLSNTLPAGFFLRAKLATPVALGATMIFGFNLTSDTYTAEDVAEVLVYDNALSTENREAVEAYISAKWGITL